MAIISYFSSGGGQTTVVSRLFKFTGPTVYIDDGDDNWRIKFLGGGELIPKKDIYVDIFAVGGGGKGSDYPGSHTNASGGGGGSGYTKTERLICLKADTTYVVTVGAANGGTSSLKVKNGATICEAAGGDPASSWNGGWGGSGGAAGSYGGWGAGAPGSDGGSGTNGEYNWNSNSYYSTGGKGQGTTTREFGEETGELYSGGGGCGTNGQLGGAGGGGNGASSTIGATAGGEYTGGGGGGGNNKYPGGADGGCGIVIIRNTRAQA